MKKVFLALALAAMAVGADAQGIVSMTRELARPDSLSGARVEVREQDDAAAAIRRADLGSGRSSVVAYEVSLFRDNSQNARENAYSVASQFSGLHPEIFVAVSYESPYFKVAAGRFVDRTDAVALCGRVAAQFPKAVVVQIEVPLEEIITMEKIEPATETEE